MIQMEYLERTLRHTPLTALHQSLHARLVPFAGYEMPLQYPTGIKQEHLHTRKKAGLFDVSHMGQIRLTGPDCDRELEKLVPADLVGMPVGRQCYTLLTSAKGGILDDLMVTRTDDGFFLVVNAARKEDDLAHLQAHLDASCRIESLEDRALLALQGPESARVLAQWTPVCQSMPFMSARTMEINGIACWVSRSGYTGEDGFELSVPAHQAEALAQQLLEHSGVEMAGLGARDTLRLEAGLCLYGHDLTEAITPIEARLTWAISKVRRPGGSRSGGYPGAQVIERQLKEGVEQRRVGLRAQGKIPVREGAEVLNVSGETVGRVTSGGFGPSVGGPVAMGYVTHECAEPGTELKAKIRNREISLVVSSLPFVEHHYYRG